MSLNELWVWLSLKRLGSGKLRTLISYFGTVEAIYKAGIYDLGEVGSLTAKEIEQLADKNLKEAEATVKICEKKKIRIISFDDALYPERLKEIQIPPAVLYWRGQEFNIDEEAVVAMVGTRKATGYGKQAARMIASEIALCGGVIVSGMARGIDTEAMFGALGAGAKVIAVLGSGADVCYPRENRKLMKAIICSGAVISEFPPGTPPNKQNFPRRNRIISALALGTVVAEAPKRSGALITASLALEQGRDVFAVPGSIFSKESEGANRLIYDGAIPVLSGRDVVMQYKNVFPYKLNLNTRKKRKEGKPSDEEPLSEEFLAKFDEDERKILSAIGRKSLGTDEIIEKTGLHAGKTLSLLTLLEIGGAVEKQAGNRFKIR